MRISFVISLFCLITTHASYARSYCPANQVGDVNGSGTVNGADTSLIQAYLARSLNLSPCQLVAADVNQDGIVDQKDVVILQAYIVRAIPSLPAVPGDLNGDGRVDGEDARILARYLASLITLQDWQRVVADVNGDGVIDQNDLNLLESAAVNLTVLPVPFAGSTLGIPSKY